MTYDTKLLKGLEFIQTRQAMDSTRKPFLVPDMFSKLKSGFAKKVVAIVSAGKPDVTIESEFAIPIEQAVTETVNPVKVEKTFKQFSSAQILDKYPLLDRGSKIISMPRKLAISSVFIGKLQTNTMPTNAVATQPEIETLVDPSIITTSVDNIVVIEEIKSLMKQRDEVASEIADLTEKQTNITSSIESKKTQFGITDEMLTENVKTLSAA